MSKFWILIVGGVAVIGGTYFIYNKFSGSDSEILYVLARAEKGSLVASVSGSGQVASSSQIDIKLKASGDVSAILAREGYLIREGGLILQLDSSDAAKAVRDAEANLAGAKLTLQKLKQPADALSIIQAENALEEATQSKKNAEDDITKAYDDALNAVANAFIDLPGVVTGVDAILNGSTANRDQSNSDFYYGLIKAYSQTAEQFRDSAVNGYKSARTAYDKNFQNYKNASRYSERSEIDSLLGETYNTTKLVSEAIKNSKNFLDLVSDVLNSSSASTTRPAILSTHQSSLQTYTATTNAHLGSLLNIKNSIAKGIDDISSAARLIAEKTEALAKLRRGADPLDVQSQELVVRQRENALVDAREDFDNYFVRAPFDGVVAKIALERGVSSSSGTVAATLVSSRKIAQISMNEVDVGGVKVGSKATLTFDAFPELTISGEVAQIDTIGAVSQGVVTYDVKIAFDTQDEKIRPSMTVSAVIVTDVENDVIIVPNSAVKSQGSRSYVDVLENFEDKLPKRGDLSVASAILPVRKIVEVGLSNDLMTAIRSGLEEGSAVVVRTTSGPLQGQVQVQQNSAFRLPGVGGGTFRSGGSR